MSKTFDFNVLNEASSIISIDSMSRDLDYIGGKSYFSETIDFLVEYNREYTEATKTLYRNILESGDNIEIINEGFSEFGAAIKKIIDKFLAFMKSLFQRFINNLNSMFKSERYLKNHEKDFSKFSTQHEFTYMGYNFTIQSDIPVTNAESEFLGADSNGYDISFTTDLKNKYDEEERKINTPDGADRDYTASNKEVYKHLKSKYDKLVEYLHDEYYDTLRAKILGKDGKISEGEFSNELFCIFRDDSSDKETIEVDSSYINDTLSRFKNYEKSKKMVEKNKKEIDLEYTRIKKDLDDMISIKGSGDERKASYEITAKNSTTRDFSGYGTANDIINARLSPDIMNVMELYKKAKVNQVQQMSNIHALAFSAKLDAMKDLFNQDKAILYKALYKIQGVAKKD